MDVVVRVMERVGGYKEQCGVKACQVTPQIYFRGRFEDALGAISFSL